MRSFHITWTVWLHLSLIVLPLVVFTAILLGLVYGYEWGHLGRSASSITLNSGYASNILYVDYSATRLILVASWSSSIAIPLIGSLLVLSSYVVAADIIWSSQRSYHGLLPTPSQLAILIDLLDAKKVAVYTWLSTFWRRGSRKVATRWVVELPAVVLLAGSGLSIAIIACDTWLHIVTTSTTKWYLAPVPDPGAEGQAYFYSREFKQECMGQDASDCSVKLGQETVAAFPNAIQDLVSGNPSIDTQVQSDGAGAFFLAPRLQEASTVKDEKDLPYENFTAQSLSTTASCDRNFASCDLNLSSSSSGSWTFSCHEGFNGSITYPNWLNIGSWWRPNDSYEAMSSHYADSSTIEVGVAMFLENNTVKTATTGSPPYGQINLLNNTVSGSFLTVKCWLSTNDFSYTSGNRSTLEVLSSRTNVLAAGIARGPLLAGYFDSSGFGNTQRDSIRSRLGITRSSLEAIVPETVVWSGLESTLAFLGTCLLGGTFNSAPAKELKLANDVIVTEVGKAPLFTLVILNLWYAAFGILLFSMAVYVLHDPKTRKDIEEVQQLLTVDGLALAAVRTNRPNLAVNDQNLRVGVEKVGGKWQFRVWEIDNPAEAEALLTEEFEEEHMK